MGNMTTLKHDIFVSTSPFGKLDQTPIRIINDAGYTFKVNDTGRRLNETEIESHLPHCRVLIAGTENIPVRILELSPNLRHISRVGIGLDGVDLNECRRRGISVSYTPDAPSPAVAEFTIGSILSCLRGVPTADNALRRGEWSRFIGRRISDITIGIVGVGRIGSLVIEKLCQIGAKDVRYFDIREVDLNFCDSEHCVRSDFESLLRESDVLSLHVPLSERTRGLLSLTEMLKMKDDAVLINTSRGGIVNEADLFSILGMGKFSSVALDVFDNEPYSGLLTQFSRCQLTPHLGSMTRDCRAKMEVEATVDACRYLSGLPLNSPVPEAEYANQLTKKAGDL
jgi:D-3-phosphoglycerate dehydrogenase